MSENNDGGPAFPRDHRYQGHNGVSTRDLFALHIASGLCASHGSCGAGNGPSEIADRAYEIADAMLKRRDQ